MERERVETASEAAARAFADAITRCDRAAALEICHPEIEFRSVLGIGGRAYIGHEGIQQYFDDVESAWAQWGVEVERIDEGADGRVVIVMTMHARGKESAVTLSERTAHIWTVKDGRLLHNESFREPDKALRALGLSS